MKPRKQRLYSAELRRLDRITEVLERIATAIENTPTRMEIDHVNNKINVNDGVGVQMGGESKVEYIHPNTAKYENFAPQGIAANNIGNVDRSTEVDSDNDNTSQVTDSGGNNKIDSHASLSGNTHHIAHNAGSFNSNSNEAIKDLSSALTNKHDKHKEL